MHRRVVAMHETKTTRSLIPLAIAVLLLHGVAIAQEAASDFNKAGLALWKLRPFDRLTMQNDTYVDIEPDRIPQGTNFDNIEEDKWVGRMGIPVPPIRGDAAKKVRFRITLMED